MPRSRAPTAPQVRAARWDNHRGRGSSGLRDGYTWRREGQLNYLHLRQIQRLVILPVGHRPQPVKMDEDAAGWDLSLPGVAEENLGCVQDFAPVIAVARASKGSQLCGIDARCPEKWQRIERQSHIIGDMWQLFSISRIIKN